MTMTALIADDEPLLAQDLRARLARLWPELDVVAVCHSGTEALARLEADKPEIAFLDIRMPGLTGLEVAARLDFPCRVVFVTAYDEYAVAAFERAAADYLLKPVGEERLAKTVERLKQAGEDSGVPLARVLEDLLRRGGMAAPAARLKWIRASVGGTVRLVPVEEVCYFQAADKYTAVVTAAVELLIRTPIKELAEQLDPESFWQIHRGTLVNARQVAGARHDESGRVLLSLRSRPEQLTVSRAYAPRFKQM
ncbi:MAG: response regulator transcription factor [Rhodocyclales bacterium]|nr:response regulator transcription factor [Rhodocyclales bacterium]